MNAFISAIDADRNEVFIVQPNSQQDVSHLQQYDATFLNIYNDLTDYLLNSVQTSVQQVLSLSESFLDKDTSQALNDFHTLYEADSLLDSHKNTIDKNVDEIIDYIKNSTITDKSKEKKILEKLDSYPVSAERLSFSALQKDIEALVTLEDDVKKKVAPILHGLQFEDQLSQSISSIKNTLAVIINLAHQDKSFNPQAAAKLMYSLLACEKDRTLFYKHILETDYHGEPAIQSDDLKNLSGETEDDTEILTFLSKIEHYTVDSLYWNSQESARSVALIIETITLVRERVEQIFEPSQDNKDTVKQLRHITTAMENGQGRKETLRLLSSTLSNRMDVDQKINELIEPIITSIQFHDRICQNMENLSHTLKTWLKKRIEVINSSVSIKDLQTDFGNTLISLMTMNEEREIVRRYISGLPEAQEDNTDDIDLF